MGLLLLRLNKIRDRGRERTHERLSAVQQIVDRLVVLHDVGINSYPIIIGAERKSRCLHRLRPREAFDLLRRASRARGARVTELAQDVVASTANPLLMLPDELTRTLPEPRPRTRSLRRKGSGRHAASS